MAGETLRPSIPSQADPITLLYLSIVRWVVIGFGASGDPGVPEPIVDPN